MLQLCSVTLLYKGDGTVDISLHNTLIVCSLVFAAGFIDSIAGGGGLISLPAYYFAGIPPHTVLGTNKFSSVFGTFFSTLRFIRSGKVNYRSSIISAAGALIGSFAGARLALMLDEEYLRYVLVILLPVIAVFILFKKSFGEEDTSSRLSHKSIIILSFFTGLILGAYDGFFGPGTGTFLIFVYSSVIGFDIVTSSGNAKIVNLTSNISAVITFILSGKVLFPLAVPAAVAGILGNLIGSKLAVKNGAKIIKPVFVLVIVLLFARIVNDMIL